MKAKTVREDFQVKIELYDYDVYPKVVRGDRESRITVRPLGSHVAFERGVSYAIRILKASESDPELFPERSGRHELSVSPDENGDLVFSVTLLGEGEHHVTLYLDAERRRRVRFSLFSVFPDLAERVPLRGDLHIHTCRSDGRESPEIVCANYRGHGYDFLAITDHHRYYPSLEVIEFYRGVTDLTLVPGEEVHLPLNPAHYVNFGGTFSVNALVTPTKNAEKAGDSVAYRSFDGKAPETVTREAFISEMRERAKEIPLEHESERLAYAVTEWIYERVKEGGGLAIFPHPYWITNGRSIPDEYTCFLLENHPFDAFEVLGGEHYFQHNGYQTSLYYEMRAKGIDLPIVGSTDSHGSTEHNRDATLASTIVFARSNTREDLISAVKEKYSVAVDTISAEYRLVGDYRLVRYASFLLENYFPLHDLACRAEGYYLKQYAVGDPMAKGVLDAMRGQISAMQRKYFDLDI